MSNNTEEKRHSVPYISWKTFTAFIAGLHGKVPARIDPSILRNMSGSSRSQLLSALKFLELVDTEGIAQDSLKELTAVYDGEQWKPALAQFLRHSYRKVLEDLDLNTATPAMLRERFRNNGGVDGGTIDFAVRFYLSALKEAGVEFSDHLVVRQRAPKGTGTRRRASTRPSDARIDETESEAPEGTFEVPFNLLGIAGGAYIPETLTPEQWDAVSQFVKMVLGYRHQAQKPKEGI